MAILKLVRGLLCGALLCMGAPLEQARAAGVTEHEIKAVFVFNFSHFVQWPADAFSSPTQPFVIGVLGGDELAARVEEAASGERVGGRALQVRRLRGTEGIGDCRILYIDRSRGADLERILAAVNPRGTLTVSDTQDAARRGAMIQLANERNRIRLLIDVDAATAAGLTISSNLLRPAEIVRPGSRRQ